MENNNEIVQIDAKCRNQYNTSPNVLSRISTKLDSCLDKINEKRQEMGFGNLSKPKITELIVRHKLFSKIELDIIHFNPEEEEE